MSRRTLSGRPVLKNMLALSGYEPDAALDVIDLGAGYGIVSSLVLELFPHARVTLQDFSAPMLAEARRRLSDYGGRLAFVESNLKDPSGSERAGGPFDLAVSAIAIHNLGDPDQMAAVYRAVRRILKPKGVFLDCDYTHTGSLERHLEWLRAAGFERVESLWQKDQTVIMAAYAS